MYNALKANRRRSTWPPHEISRAQTPRHNNFPDPDQTLTLPADDTCTRRTCSETCSGDCLGRELTRLIQATQTMNNGREKI